MLYLSAHVVCLNPWRSGSSSIWLHMGAFGPRRVVTMNAHSTPRAPYKLSDNPSSLVDRADLVFIDPVGTGLKCRRQSSKQRFLRRGPRRKVIGAVHYNLHQPERSLEVAEIPDWRKLGHIPLGCSFELPAIGRTQCTSMESS